MCYYIFTFRLVVTKQSMDTASRTRNSQVQPTLCQNLKHIYECQMYCDVTLTTNQSAADNHQSVECHKLVLLSSSPYFKALLGTKDDQINIIDVSPVNINVVKEIVGFLYNGECLLHHSTLVETLETSVAWKLPLLTEECFTYMKKFKNLEYAGRFYEVCLKHQNIDAIYDMSNYIRGHLSELSEGNHLVQLSLKAFCEIIKSDEVNVDTEDVICATAMSLIENEQSDEDITKCLKLIRYEHLKPDFLFDVAVSQPIMKNEPQQSYLKSALMYQCSKNGTPPLITARFWGPRRQVAYINNNKKKKICGVSDGKRIILQVAPEWIDGETAVHSRGSTVLFVSSLPNKPEYGSNIVLASLSKPFYLKSLPDLPIPVHAAGVVNTGTHVYVLGGARYTDGVLRCSMTGYRLCLMKNEWETSPQPLSRVHHPVTLVHNQHVYLMGSHFSEGPSPNVQRYNIETSKWTFIKDLPFGVYNWKAAAVVYKNRVTVVTSKRLMSYQQESDTWSVKEYEDLGNVATAMIVDEELCTCVKKDDNGSLMSYDEEANVWKVKIANMPNIFTDRYCFAV